MAVTGNSALLSIDSLLLDPMFVRDTDVLIRTQVREANGDLTDIYTEKTYKCNIQGASQSSNTMKVQPKEEGERDLRIIDVYTYSPLQEGDFVIHNNLHYRVYRDGDFALHGHYYVTAIRHEGPQGARSQAFVIT